MVYMFYIATTYHIALVPSSSTTYIRGSTGFFRSLFDCSCSLIPLFLYTLEKKAFVAYVFINKTGSSFVGQSASLSYQFINWVWRFHCVFCVLLMLLPAQLYFNVHFRHRWYFGRLLLWVWLHRCVDALASNVFDNVYKTSIA